MNEDSLWEVGNKTLTKESVKSDVPRLFPFYARTLCRQGPILLLYEIEQNSFQKVINRFSERIVEVQICSSDGWETYKFTISFLFTHSKKLLPCRVYFWFHNLLLRTRVSKKWNSLILMTLNESLYSLHIFSTQFFISHLLLNSCFYIISALALH